MDWLEQELAQALARKEPAPGFDGRVRARMRRAPRWMAAAAALVAIAGGSEAWRQHEGQVAKEQVMTAMRIAGSKLNRVQVQLKGSEQ